MAGRTLCISFALAALVCQPANAQQTILAANALFDLSVSTGVMSMSSKEIVYAARGNRYGSPAGALESRLDWRTRAAGTAALTLGVNALPRTRLETSLLLPIIGGDGKMTDVDWLNPATYPRWSDRSQHPDTRLGRAFTLDLKALRRVYESEGFSLDAVAGLRHVEQQWTAYGGRFVYTEKTRGACDYGAAPPVYLGDGVPRNCIGAFDPVAQIAFRQRFETPYLGLRLGYAVGRWALSADLVGSPFVVARDRDLHVGATVFDDQFRNQKMLGLTARAGYALARNVQFFLEADSQSYFLRKGLGVSHPIGGGRAGSYTAGLDLRAQRLSAGVRLALD